MILLRVILAFNYIYPPTSVPKFTHAQIPAPVSQQIHICFPTFADFSAVGTRTADSEQF